MSLIRTVARPLLASMFVSGGAYALLNSERLVPAAEPVVEGLSEVPAVPSDVPTAIRLNGAVQVVAGSLLALGRFQRLSAAALACTLVPVTWAGHRFWEAEDESERTQQRIHFLKNLSMLGGLLMTAADTGSGPSLSWRLSHHLPPAARG